MARRFVAGRERARQQRAVLFHVHQFDSALAADRDDAFARRVIDNAVESFAQSRNALDADLARQVHEVLGGAGQGPPQQHSIDADARELASVRRKGNVEDLRERVVVPVAALRESDAAAGLRAIRLQVPDVDISFRVAGHQVAPIGTGCRAVQADVSLQDVADRKRSFRSAVRPPPVRKTPGFARSRPCRRDPSMPTAVPVGRRAGTRSAGSEPGDTSSRTRPRPSVRSGS